MIQEINNRIDQIWRGEVPKSMWTKAKLSEISTVITGSTPPTVNTEAFRGNNLFITPSDFQTSKYITGTIRHLSDSFFISSRIIPANSIYVVCIGATVGKINMCQREAACNQQINAVVPNSDVDSEFLYYDIDYTFNRDKKRYTGEQTLPIVNKSTFSGLLLNIPPFSEQQKIAEILTTQDKIIELKEKLITEKQRQKKYLMQQLLTGRKRLAGYSKKWCVVKLKNIAKKEKLKNVGFEYSLVLSNSAQHGIIPQEEQFDKEIASASRIDEYYIVRDGYFVYNPRISTTAPCGPININETGHTGIMSPLYTVFSINCDYIDNSYMKQYFKSTCWFQHMKSVANYGARHDRMSITDDDFFAMPIAVPELEEQQAISAVFAVADKEISLLQQSLEKEKQKKKALMQLLLTGIVRVGL